MRARVFSLEHSSMYTHCISCETMKPISVEPIIYTYMFDDRYTMNSPSAMVSVLTIRKGFLPNLSASGR